MFQKSSLLVDHPEDLFRCLFDESSDGLVIFDPRDLRICEANRSAQDMIGQSPADLMNCTIPELFDDSDLKNQFLQACLSLSEFRTRDLILNEFEAPGSRVGLVLRKITWKRQDLGLIVLSALPDRNVNSDLVTPSDTTVYERSEARIDLQSASDERADLLTSRDAVDWQLRQLVHGINAIVWEADARTWKFKFVSEEAEAMLGYPVEEWLTDDKFWVSHLHPEDRDAAVEYCVACTQLGQDHQFDYRARKSSGDYIWLRDIVRVITEADGRPVTIRGVMIDIDAQKRMEQALRESEAQRERTEKFALVMPVQVGLDGAWQKVTPRLCEFLGYTQQELIGEGCSEVTHPLDREEDRRQIGLLLSGKIKSFDREKRYLRKDGQLVWAYINCTIVTDRGGQPVHFLTYIRDITRRVEAEQKLRESEQRFRTIFEQAAVGVALIDTATGRFVRVNRKCEQLMGYSAAEMLNLSFMELTADGLEEDLDNMHKLHAGEISEYNMEKCLLRKDGFPIWVNLTVSPTWLPGEAAHYHIAIIEDISARKQMEQALIESEKSLEKAQQISRLGNWQLDLKNGSLTASAETYRILGIENPDQLDPQLSSAIERFVHADDRHLLGKAIQEAITTRSPRPIEFRHVDASGEIRHLRADAEMLTNTELVDGMFGTLQDITERKQTELALRESEQKFRVISENCPAMVAIFQQGKLEYANDMTCLILGYSNEELQKKDIVDVVHPDHRDLVRDRHLRRLAGESVPARYDIKLQTKLGATCWADFQVGLIEYEGKQAVLGTGLDITERRLTEERLHQKEIELAHVARLTTMGEMVAGIAHEINQPLSAISNFADACTIELRKLDMSETERIEQHTTLIGQQAVRCGDIIRRLRSYVDRKKLDETTVKINNVIQESLALLCNEIRQSVIDVECDMVIPSPVVRGNPVELQQVLVNLLSNALDAMSQFNSRQHLAVRSEVEDGFVRIEVEDSGPGIDAGDFESLFETFFTTKSDGMGMGLAISRSIIERHQGQLWAENRKSGGAAFRLRLPLA